MTPVLALHSLLLVPPVLAQEQPPPNAPEFGGSSPIALVVILLLFIAVFFLVRSMNTHLRKLPTSFDKPDATEQASMDEAGGSGRGETNGAGGGSGADRQKPDTNG